MLSTDCVTCKQLLDRGKSAVTPQKEHEGINQASSRDYDNIQVYFKEQVHKETAIAH